MKAKLKKKAGPYRKGTTITTGEPGKKELRVDPGRFEAWQSAGFLETEEPDAGAAEEGQADG